MLRARSVSFAYGSGAPGVVQIDLEVHRGEVVGLVGPNGAGKSTLLRLLEGSLRPDRGELDKPPRRTPQGRMDVGYAAEEAAHFEVLSGTANAVFFARAGGLTRGEAEAAVDEHMGLLGLTADAHRPVAEYSFGARRKLSLVEALAHGPFLLLLDEPTVGLDASSRDALGSLVSRRAQDGVTTVVASHDLAFLTESADRIVFMHDGRVVGGGLAPELLSAVGDAKRFEFTLGAPLERPPTLPDDGFRVVLDGNPFVVETDQGHSALPAACRMLVQAGAVIHAVTVREAGLAEAFRRITGEELGPPRSPKDPFAP